MNKSLVQNIDYLIGMALLVTLPFFLFTRPAGTNVFVLFFALLALWAGLTHKRKRFRLANTILIVLAIGAAFILIQFSATEEDIFSWFYE